MKKITTMIVALTCLVPSLSMAAGGDIAAGKAKAAVCAACHGAAGISAIPMYPNLAGQKEMYLVNALKAYKAGQRTGGMAPVMAGQAMALSDADINNVAAYFSSLK
ncbi:c-type cytochrome [Moritella marina ATCC 15381]|uniref:C-type cytochrome n=1 Tax=Moritella marina ATCC 15381 TaxID=1202962 RepID=A0A5J6WQ77_MORMI|nr:c-type cytochrome [Moritella marina]QFI40333.1 c-type cytochrome [Moritella marina ATCC 15381]